MSRYLPVLAFLSGVSGIAYELMYMRVLSSYLGNAFYVGAAILTVFFLGMAAGAYIAPRFVTRLKLIELGIGLYAVFTVLLVQFAGLSITTSAAALPFGDVGNLILFVGLLLAAPAFLIGFSTPLFTLYLQDSGRTKDAFSSTYILYNTGAAVSVLVVEYFLIRLFGMSMSLLCFAVINFLIALSLEYYEASTLKSSPTDIPKHNTSLLVPLFLISVVSGVVQLGTLALLERIIGPLQENFALVLAVMLLAIGLGTAIVTRWRLSLSQLSITAALSLVAVFSLLSVGIEVYTNMVELIGDSYIGMAVARMVFVVLIILPIFTILGGTVQAVQRNRPAGESGLVLSISALGNTVGFLLFLFVLYQPFILPVIFVYSVIGLLLLYFVMQKQWRVQCLELAIVVIVGCTTIVSWWPSFVGIIPYHQIPDRELRTQLVSDVQAVMQHRRYGNDVTIITSDHGTTDTLIFNGYLSLVLNESTNVDLHEALVGALGSRFSSATGTALVFGLGTGISAAAVADSYDHVVVAEINPAMRFAVEYFKQVNDDVLTKENVEIDTQDGLITLMARDQTYDVILNTVTTPAYFSANKLWTRDVFEAVSKKLRPGGVFVGWIDSRLTITGVTIMVHTLEQVFTDCVFVQVTGTYNAFVCSNEPIAFKPGRAVHFLSQRLDDGLTPEAIDTLITTRAFRIPAANVTNTPLNTLDHPVLEFIYAIDRSSEAQSLYQWLSPLQATNPFTGGEKSVEEQTWARKILE